MDAFGRSWALASDLLERYELSFVEDARLCRVLIVAIDVSSTFREEGVQAEVGWPLFEMSLQSGSAPVIIRRFLGPEPMGFGPDVAWWNLPRNSALP